MLELLIYRAQPHGDRVIPWNERLLREGDFDWTDVHLRHLVETVGLKINWVAERWSSPIASTEFNGPDERAGVVYADERQAAEVPVRLEAAFRAGLDRVFYSHLVESPHVEEIFFREGLIALDGFRRKPVFEAYRTMIVYNAPRCPETSSGRLTHPRSIRHMALGYLE